MVDKYIVPSDSLANPKQPLRRKSVKRLRLFLGIAVVLNAAIGGITLFLLQLLAPSYISKGAAIISGVGTQGSVELAEPGISSSSGQTPYGYLLKVDPRENYQFVAGTEAVLAKAAAAVDMSVEEFGEPTIWLNKGTTILEFAVDGTTPEEAQQKAWAFYQAWSDRITDLRNDEATRQNNNIEQELTSASRQLETAQEKISNFRGQSPLKIASQIDQLAKQVENLRIQKASLLVEQVGFESRFRQLSKQLNFSPEQAGDALILLDDKVFQSSLQNYSEASANLEVLSSIWSANSPQVLAEQDKQENAQQAMIERSRIILGKSVDLPFLAQLDLGGGGRRDLVEELVRLQVEQAATTTQIQATEGQIEQFESRLKKLTQEQFILNRLEREAQISESIFAEGLARLDVDKPDYATYYPPLQLVEEPILPLDEENGSQTRIILLGGLAFATLSTTGLIMFWWGRSQQENIFCYSSSSNHEEKV
ncbi:MAG: GumC family protein [Cyanophyceae cyanobacterium]